MKGAWGSKETQFFYKLDPVQILDALDSLGFKTTGRVLALNSMENRVYEVEIELDLSEEELDSISPSEKFKVAKFYRPGRWTKEQILEEHTFLLELKDEELPVVAPIAINGETLFHNEELGLFYCVYPKFGGRHPDEMDDQEIEQLGRLLARLHNVGGRKKASHRISLTPETYGTQNLDYLLDSEQIMPLYLESYKSAASKLIDLIVPLFEKVNLQRIHGDCHIGNVIKRYDGLCLLDFDDFVNGPPVQDIWPLIPGRDYEANRKREVLIKAYEEMRDFDRGSLILIEPLRALRYIHFTAWTSKRWEDPAFKLTFPHFGSEEYWTTQINDLYEQIEVIKNSLLFRGF